MLLPNEQSRMIWPPLLVIDREKNACWGKKRFRAFALLATTLSRLGHTIVVFTATRRQTTITNTMKLATNIALAILLSSAFHAVRIVCD